MSLIVKHNRAEHTHENEQFRRVAISLKRLFEQQKWSGILIGNPFNDNYSRFRPDGILLYNHGLIIIDFKAYSGNIKLPPNKREFEDTAWYTESETDKKRTLIKAGNRFINPFKQLHSYREAFKEIVTNELSLKGAINKSRTCALNIFSGPTTIQNQVPGEIPYYKLVQESDLGTMLYDYSSENKFSKELAEALSLIFNAEEWQEHIKMPSPTSKIDRTIEIDKNVEQSLEEFLKMDESGVFILESMSSHDRDDWVEHILINSQEYGIPQVETWIHSARIGRKVSNRMGMELQSLYNTIYGGAPKKLNIEESDPDEKQFEEQLQEIIPIRTDDSIDESAVVILHEAHLVSRSLHQSELLRFGSGRLLEDLFTFLNLNETKRKLICVGDPYSLTYGKDVDSATNTDTLTELFSGSIKYFRNGLPMEDFEGKMNLRASLAKGIENKMFNQLQYPWTDVDLKEITKEEVPTYLTKWFSKPLETEPVNTVMVYSNKDAKKINLWVKKHCLKNGKSLSKNDLLLLNNNVNIPDETGFGQPTKLSNGMFLLVESVGETVSKSIPLRQSKKPIVLNFTKILIKCLSLPSQLDAEVYMLDNFFNSDSGLSKEEQIAFRVFVNMLVKDMENQAPFEKSYEFIQLQQDKAYKTSLGNESKLKKKLESGEKVKTKLDKQQRELSKIERNYKRNFRNRLLSNLSQNNPFVNAIHVHYGWALTVHKSVGSSFSNAIINVYQGENRGVTNIDYFRWLYSSLTTISNKVFVINPQLIDPLKEIQFEDTAIIGNNEKTKNKALLTFNNYVAEEPFVSIIPETLHSNVIGAICELSKLLKQQGLILHSVTKNGEYLTKAAFSTPRSTDTHYIVAINNRGAKDKWGISSIRTESDLGNYTEIVNQSIEALFNKYMGDGQEELELPDGFRLPIYSRWKEVLNQKGYDLKLIKSHNNQDVFWVGNMNGKFAKFRVWYRNDGFFTKIALFEKCDSEISEDLKKWLLDGN